jgi:hypothetical protein
MSLPSPFPTSNSISCGISLVKLNFVELNGCDIDTIDCGVRLYRALSGFNCEIVNLCYAQTERITGATLVLLTSTCAKNLYFPLNVLLLFIFNMYRKTLVSSACRHVCHKILSNDDSFSSHDFTVKLKFLASYENKRICLSEVILYEQYE